ncbi:hypothetical protein TRIP_B200025 [uncultured Desulfatiglans sp.]|nr:hypothetical protein TRIP_B200025 [uncultured Desulfatiglans sp.]
MMEKGDERAYPSRPIVGVAAVVFDRDEVILVRRGKPPGKGEWSLPGGAVELGETLVGALKREILEELSITVEIGGLVGVFDKVFPDEAGRIIYHYVLVDFWAELRGGVPVAGSDIDALCRIRAHDCGDSMGLDGPLGKAVARAVRLREHGRSVPLPPGPLF